MDVGRDDDFVFINEESWCLKSNQKILLRGDFGLPLTNLGAETHRPRLDLPAGQALGHLEADFNQAALVGRDRTGPEGGIGEVRADRWLLHGTGPCAATRLVGRHALLGHRCGIGHRCSFHRGGHRRGRSTRRGGCCHHAAVHPSGATSSHRHRATATHATIKPGHLLAQHSAEDTEVGHADLTVLQQVAEDAIERTVASRMMMPTPLPEEFFDLRDVAAARDVFDALVVDAENRRTDERLACVVGQFDLDLRVGTRFVFGLRRQNLDVDDPLLGGDDDFASLLVVLAVRNREGFEEEVRHVLLNDDDILDRVLSL